jgi:hypothetical protein
MPNKLKKNFVIMAGNKRKPHHFPCLWKDFCLFGNKKKDAYGFFHHCGAWRTGRSTIFSGSGAGTCGRKEKEPPSSPATAAGGGLLPGGSQLASLSTA